MKSLAPKILTASLLSFSLSVVAHAASSSTISDADKTFVHKVGMGGMFEVDSSKIAEKKASASDVKAFAENEVKEHTKVGDELKAAATAKGITVPMKRDSAHQKLIDVLNGESGQAFDETYLKDMEQVHDLDGGLFAKEAKSTKDEDMKAFAAKTVKIVQRHIRALKDIRAQMGK